MKWGVTFDSQLEIITSYTSCQLFESLFSLCCCDSESVQYKHMLLTLTNTTNCRTNIRFVAASRQKPRRMKLPFLFLLPPSLLLVKEISWIVNNVWSQVFQGDSWGGGGCWSATVLLSPWTKLKKTTKSRLLSWIRLWSTSLTSSVGVASHGQVCRVYCDVHLCLWWTPPWGLRTGSTALELSGPVNIQTQSFFSFLSNFFINDVCFLTHAAADSVTMVVDSPCPNDSSPNRW